MRLSPTHFALLLEEVAAMARADRPLAIGLADLHHRSLGRIGKAAGLVTNRIAAGQSAEAAIAEVGGRGGKQAAAAIRALQTTGSSAAITRLAEAMRRQSELRSQMLVAMIYPLITAVIAYLVVALGVTSLVIQSWPSELVGKQDSTQFIAFCVWLREYFWLPPLIFGLSFASYSWARRSGIEWARRPNRSAEHHAWSTFCDMLAVQISAELPLPQAVSLAADATGNEAVRRRTQGAPERLAEAPPMIAWLLAHAAKHSLTDTSRELRVLADWYRHEALRRSRFWTHWAPSLITAVVGGAAALVYCLLVLRPLFEGMARVGQ